MIIGLLLGVSISVFITSSLLMITGYTGVLRENLLTGAAIGTNELISYSTTAFIFSLIAIFLFILVLKRKFNRLKL